MGLVGPKAPTNRTSHEALLFMVPPLLFCKFCGRPNTDECLILIVLRRPLLSPSVMLECLVIDLCGPRVLVVICVHYKHMTLCIPLAPPGKL